MKTRLERFANLLGYHEVKVVSTGRGKRGASAQEAALQAALNAGADDTIDGWEMTRRGESYHLTGRVGEENVDIDVNWVMTSRGPVKLK